MRRGVLAILLIAAGGYAWVTRPAALRARLHAALSAAGWRARSLGEISLLPWGTLRIEGLELEPVRATPIVAGPLRPARVRIAAIRMHCDLTALIVGRVRPRSVDVGGAVVRLVRPERLAAGGAEARGRRRARWSGIRHWPRLRFQDVDVGIVDADAPQVVRRRWIIGGLGEARRLEGQWHYRVRIWQQRGAAATAESALGQAGLLVEARMASDGLTLASDWIDDEMLRAVAPVDVAEQIDALELRGLARVQTLRLGPGRRVHAMVQFERVGGVLPVEAEAHASRRWARLHDVSGVLEYTRPPDGGRPELRAEVRGRLNDAHVRVTCTAGGRGPGSGGQPTRLGPLRLDHYRLVLELRGLTLPDLQRDRAWITSPRLPRPVRAFFADYQPRGRLNASVTIEGRTVGGADTPSVRVSGRLEAIDGSGRYHGFPYPLEHVRGAIRISDEGIEIEQIRGEHGPAQIVITGHVNQPRAWTGFELNITARNAPLDEALYQALPPEFRKLWNRVDPIGLCDASIRVWRPDGTPQAGAPPPRVYLTARVLGGSLAIEDQRLEHATGTVTIDGPRIVLAPLRGFLDGVPVALRGTLELDRVRGRLRPELTVEAADVSVRRDVDVRLPGQPSLGRLVFDARADATGRIEWHDGRIEQRYQLDVRDGTLTGIDGTTCWEQLRGRIEQQDGVLRLEALRGRRGAGLLRIDGRVPRQADTATGLDLRIDARDPDVNDLLGAAIPPRWSAVRDALGLGGAGHVQARLQADPQTRARVEAAVTLSAERMIPAILPAWLRDVRARLTLRATGFDVLEATARHALGGAVSLAGRGDWSVTPPRAALSLRLCDLPVNEALLVELPAPLADLVGQLRLRGRADLWLDPLEVVAGDPPRWAFSGLLELHEAQMFVGFDLVGASGWATGAGRVGAGGSTGIRARFHLDEGLLAGRPLRNWDGRLVKPAGEPRVVLEDVEGQFCGGRIAGRVEVRLDTRDYDLSCLLNDVSLPLLLARDGRRAGEFPGRMDGRVFVRGSVDEPTQHDGGGELRIRNAPLRSIPLAEPVARAAAERRRSIGQRVRVARLKFAWRGTRLRFSEVELLTDRQRFIGTGWWETSTDAIGFDLVETQPPDAPRVAVLTDLLEAAGQELIAYRISGTLAEPKVTIEPLHRLTGPVRRLLGGGRGEP